MPDNRNLSDLSGEIEILFKLATHKLEHKGRHRDHNSGGNPRPEMWVRPRLQEKFQDVTTNIIIISVVWAAIHINVTDMYKETRRGEKPT